MAGEINIVQFGLGKFIKGYFDWLLFKTDKNIKVYGLYFTKRKKYFILKQNKCKFKVILKGNRVKIDEVDIIKDIFHIDNDENIKKLAKKNITFIVSNTTEKAFLDTSHKKSYPFKLTYFLYEIYQSNNNAELTIVPLELIENNGKFLKNQILSIAKVFFNEDFLKWIVANCEFVDTVVDCIVTSENNNLEIEREEYYSFYSTKSNNLKDLFNRELNVHFFNNLNEIREIKIKILNGIHTFLVCTAYLDGKKTVYECLTDSQYAKLIDKLFNEEILPTIKNKKLAFEFYKSTINRFKNPFITHLLQDIALNTFEKFYERLGKTILEYEIFFHKKPKLLMKAFENLRIIYPNDQRLDKFEKYISTFQKI